jgi:nitrogenase-associated protein
LAAVATIQFYQKPGCATNAGQKRMLEAAGHIVVARSLLAEPWTAESLRGFFGSTPIAAWFNPAAPRVKSGEVLPDRLDAASAIALMLDDPLLIRRPLVEMGGQRCAGFDREPVTSLLGGFVDKEIEAGRRRPRPARIISRRRHPHRDKHRGSLAHNTAYDGSTPRQDHDQAIYPFALFEVLLDYFVDILRRGRPIPGAFRIDHHQRTCLAETETARGGEADLGQTLRLDRLAQSIP